MGTLFLVLWGLASAPRSQAQILDCNCVSNLPALYTLACTGTIPNLCVVATNCYLPSMTPAPGYTCTQTPAAGTVVTTMTPITFTIVENGTLITNSCNVNFYVAAFTNRFDLICSSNLFVACNDTNWAFVTPYWTNSCCPVGSVLIIPNPPVTNWPTITAGWTGISCNGVAAFCSQTVTFQNMNGTACDCLDIFCSTNIIIPTCLGTTAGALTNVFWPLPVVSNYCIGTITNIFCVPPSGSPFPVGTNPVTCVVQDDLGNVETCTFNVIVLPDLDPPNVACANLTIPCGSAWAPVPPPAFDVCCGPAVIVMLQSIFTNVVSQCETKIFLDWHVTDCNGNSTNCSEVITIVDITPPVFVCNSNQTYQCSSAAGTPGSWQPVPPVAFDACCPVPPIVTLVGAFTNGALCNQTITFVWQAEDCCTNLAYCTENITLVDTTPPILNCQPFRQVECGTNIIGDPPTAFDQCCGTNVTVSMLSVVTNFQSTCFSQFFVTWQGVDCCTNIAICSQLVQVVDTTPPNVLCPPDTNINCGQPLIFTPPTAFDDCCGALVTISPIGLFTNSAASCPYSVMARWLIADCCGNVTNCDQTIHIVDTVPPVITCGPDQTVPCGSSWSLSTPTAFDACCTAGITPFLQSITTNSSPPCLEVITAVWATKDCCGNQATCTETVTIVDTTPPVILCNSNQTYACTLSGTPGSWQPTPPTAFDVCCGPIAPLVSLVGSVTNGNQCVQTITLVWSATDCCTNTAYCTETVTIVDTTPPVINCQPFRQVECGSNFLGDLPTAFDQCCGTNVTVSVANIITNFTSPCFSSYLVVWQAVDCCTNIATCTQQVNVVDTTPPNVLCPPNTNVVCGQPLIFTPPTAFDDCCGGLVTVTLQNLITNASGVVCPYSVTAHWLVVDCCGNATNCNQTIDLIDTVPPVITCGPNLTLPCGSSWTLTPATATDACCLQPPTVTLASLTTNSSPPCLEVVTATWTATDCCGNSASCTQTITIVDLTPPVIQCNSNKVFNCAPGAVGGGWQPTPPPAFDVCCGPVAPLVSLVGTVTNGNQCNLVITLVWSAADCCSNTAYCTETVSIIDTNPPVINCAPLKFVECGTGWTFDPPTAFDLCCGTNVTINVASNLTIISSPCFSIYERYWTATDCCSNVAVCSQRVIEQDTLPPMVNCPSNGVIQCGQPLVFTPPTATDLCCPAAGITITPLPLSTNSGVNCPIEIRQTWIITDCCGNATNCTQIIHVVDTVPPVITCPPNLTLPCGSTWTLVKPTATDACCVQPPTVTLTSLTTNSSPPCLEVITATWTATDCCSNSATCTQTITIVDLTPPVIQCKSNQVYACGPGSTGVGWQPTPPPAFDACCGPIAPLVSLVGSVTNGNLCGQTITLIWSATDCCTNTAYCTETVSIIDTNPPIITCAPLKFVECGTGWTFDPPTAFDVCCGTNVTINVASNLTIISSPCFSIYEQFWTATDCCSNVAVCSQRVIEQDTLPPMVICPPNQAIECGQPVVFGVPFATDLCCPPTGLLITAQTTITNIVSPCFKVLVKNWVITDCCGNSSTCSQIIEILDTTPPVIVCGANQTVQCGLPFAPNPPISVIDACCGTIVSLGLPTFTTNSIGPCAEIVQVIWPAFDCCGNTAYCTNSVSIVDTLPPVINCPPGPRLVQCGQPLLPPVVSDQCCSNVTMSLLNTTTNTIGNCTNQVILAWQATDCCGNTALCVETNLIVDLVPPSIVCVAPVFVNCGTPIVFTDPLVFDACCGTNVTLLNLGTTVFGSSPCFRIHLRSWQAVDCCGNVTNCNQLIVEQDVTPPVITGVSNQTVQCDLFPFAWPVPTATDACCGANVTLSIVSNSVSGSCPRIHVRVYKATDCCGNTSFITQIVTEVDTIPPIIGCPPNFTVTIGSPWNFGNPLAADSCCPSGVFAVSTITNTVNACIKNITRTWIAYDCCSNSATCSQTVFIINTPPPNDLCQNAFPLFINVPPICGSNICATPSLPGSLTNTPCGSSVNAPDVWYVMTPTCSGVVRINTCNPCTGKPIFDTVLSAYTGPCPGVLTQVPGGCNDDLCGLQSIITINVTAGQTYYIRVSGWAGATGWFGLQAQQLSTSPPPNDYCTNAIPVTIGSPAACGTTACASPSLSNSVPTIPIPCGASIQANDVWYRFTPTCTGPVRVDTCGVCPGSNTFNTVLSAYTGSCGALSQVACNNNALQPGCILQSSITFMGTAGVTYYIRVAGVGTASGQFQLNIQQNIIPPPNDLCPNAIPITAGTYAWNNCGATASVPAATCATFFHDIWYRFTANCAGPVWINTCGTTLNTYLAVYTGPCSSLSQVICNDNATAGPCAPGSQSFVSFNAVAGQTYFIRVGTPSGVMGAGQLTLVGPTPPLGTCPPPGPCSWKMYRILGNPNCIPWSWSLSSPCCAFVGASSAGPVCAGNANTLAAAFVASINSVCPTMNAIAFPMPWPNQGRFLICSPCGTNLTLSVGAAGVLPQNQCVVANTGGWSPIPVGWCSFNPDIDELPPSGTDYNGNGMDDAFDIDLGTSEDANANGIPDEADCLVPDVDIVPEGLVVQLGDALMLDTIATGSAPLSYQWNLNGSPVVGATGGTLQVASVTANDVGLYSVTASNHCGVTTSAAVEVSLSQPVLLDAAFDGEDFHFTVNTKTGFNYVVEYKNDLNDPAWTTLATVPGIGGPQVIYDNTPAPQKRFYRVRGEMSPSSP